MRWVFQIFLSAVVLERNLSQDIVFPTNEGTSHVSGNIGNPGQPAITERIPVKIPGECPENMLSYPGNGNVSSWICDCIDKFVYFPDKNNCYKPYSRGPCLERQIVVLDPDDVIPKCIDNPCFEKNEVIVNGTCAQIGTVGGICGPKKILIINETTFQLECTELDIAPFFIITAPTKGCPLGSRRNSLGYCKRII